MSNMETSAVRAEKAIRAKLVNDGCNEEKGEGIGETGVHLSTTERKKTRVVANLPKKGAAGGKTEINGSDITAMGIKEGSDTIITMRKEAAYHPAVRKRRPMKTRVVSIPPK